MHYPTKDSFLTERDYQMFESSCISRKLVDTAGIYRVSSEEGARLVGRRVKANHDYGGLVFLYRWPGNANVREYRLRRDVPDEELQPDGSIKESAKYLGRRSVDLYFTSRPMSTRLGSKIRQCQFS
jgi:hypothetical protein